MTHHCCALQPARGHPSPAEHADPPIIWRAGIDLNPLDVTDLDDAAWLRALVWADHRERALLLDDALRAAGARPTVPMHAGEAAETLPAVLGHRPTRHRSVRVPHRLPRPFRPLDRERFEHLVVVLSTGRTIYWGAGRTSP